ncbi:hypothetical protein ABW19_dt0202220 [Dactylella cylindrospora]|nr:hypothetical protein ABW19_dt0202220 [Dactylella cylindrospora]
MNARTLRPKRRAKSLSKDAQSSVEDYTFSTPRSEVNNPMADPSVLVASASKDTDPPAEPSKKLSAAGASASLLKRADPKDLPSYPSRGIQNLESSAGKAALLAHSQSKSPELWKPDPLPAAGAAASLAHSIKTPEPWNPGKLPTAAAAASLAGESYKTPEAWQPTSSKSASRAATHVKDKKSIDSTWRPSSSSNSSALAAAGLANQALSTSPSKTVTTSTTTPSYDINRINALASQNAQNRLTTANPPPSQSQTDRNMNDILRAATISMSKNSSKSAPTPPKSTAMPPSSYYSHIPTSPPTVPAESPATAKLNRKSSLAAASAAATEVNLPDQSSKSTYERQTKYYPHLEEAARKAASQRLARLQAEHDKARKASGLPPNWQKQGARSALASSGATSKPTPATTAKGTDATDYARALKIKTDTAKLTQQMESVDKDRQARDYLALLAVAEKRVKSQMQDLETRVAEDQGRVPKHLQEEWDAKAKILSEEYERKRTAESESKKGKIDMGGGLWYDREDLERIAKGNVQPILDEINEKADKERARLEVLRLEPAEKAAAKTRREAEKAEERQRKAELKESQRQEKERLKAEKQPSKATTAGAVATTAGADGGNPRIEELDDDDMEELEPRPMSAAGHDRVDRERELHEESKKERGWFGSIQRKLTRKDKGKEDDDKNEIKRKISEPIPYVPEAEIDDGNFGEDSSSISSPEKTSVRDVALAGTGAVSPLSVSDEDNVGQRRMMDDMKRHARYIPSSDSDSSTSSDDLYTTQTFNPLTSATYNPGFGDDMPAFVPDTGSDSGHGQQEADQANHSSDNSDNEEKRQGVKKHHTFGAMLKKPFAGFSKDEIQQEEEKEKEVQQEQDATLAAIVAEKDDNEPIKLPLSPPRKSEDNDEFQEARDQFEQSGKGVTTNPGEGVRDIGGASAAATEGKKSMDSDTRASRFSEIL